MRQKQNRQPSWKIILQKEKLWSRQVVNPKGGEQIKSLEIATWMTKKTRERKKYINYLTKRTCMMLSSCQDEKTSICEVVRLKKDASAVVIYSHTDVLAAPPQRE